MARKKTTAQLQSMAAQSAELAKPAYNVTLQRMVVEEYSVSVRADDDAGARAAALQLDKVVSHESTAGWRVVERREPKVTKAIKIKAGTVI